MIKKILLALVAVALVAMPAFASVQNVKVSGDINSAWLSRNDFNVGINDNSNRNYEQNLFLTQTRLRVDADLTDNVSTTVGLINERAWGTSDNTVLGGRSASAADVGANDININLAYVTLREMLYSPLTVTVGRQAFAFGNSFVIDSAGSNNSASYGGLRGVAEDLTMGTNQDAVRLTFDYKPLTIDVIASKISNSNLAGKAPQKDDVDLFGTNANYKLGDQWNTVVEGYFWSKIDNSTAAAAGGNQAKGDTVYMPGARVSTTPIKGMNMQGEVAWQRGNKASTDGVGAPDNVTRDAMGAQAIVNYMLPFESLAKWSPVLTGVATIVTGDHTPGTPGTDQTKYTAWDPMFENQGGGTIYNTLFNLTNAHIYVAKASVKPMEDVTAWASWTGLWLDREVRNIGASSDPGQCSGASCFTLLQPDGSTLTPTVSTNKHLGDEVDVGLTYAYTEDVTIGATAGWFNPGSFFVDAHKRASQYMINGNVAF